MNHEIAEGIRNSQAASSKRMLLVRWFGVRKTHLDCWNIRITLAKFYGRWYLMGCEYEQRKL